MCFSERACLLLAPHEQGPSEPGSPRTPGCAWTSTWRSSPAAAGAQTSRCSWSAGTSTAPRDNNTCVIHNNDNNHNNSNKQTTNNSHHNIGSVLLGCAAERVPKIPKPLEPSGRRISNIGPFATQHLLCAAAPAERKSNDRPIPPCGKHTEARSMTRESVVRKSRSFAVMRTVWPGTGVEKAMKQAAWMFSRPPSVHWVALLV